MRILVLGGDGMLGHQLLRQLKVCHETRVTLRRGFEDYRMYHLFDRENSYASVDVRDSDRLVEVLGDFRPQAIINAVGVVKQRLEAESPIPSIQLNALLPHRLAVLAHAIGARLIHISTDCVFSGRAGGYTEESPSDAEDLYGRTKFLGEVSSASCLTLRTSIIGLELSRKSGLLEWFLAQRGAIKGYTRAIYSGLTTLELARAIERLLVEFPGASGLYHVSSEPISKYDLLTMIRDALGMRTEIAADRAFHCDRSLKSDRFRKDFDYAPPGWPVMVGELAEEIKGKTHDPQ